MAWLSIFTYFQYKILLYLNKQQPMANATISQNFVFTVQDSNYVNFYDDTRQSWSLNYDNEAQQLEFAKQVVILCSIFI